MFGPSIRTLLGENFILSAIYNLTGQRNVNLSRTYINLVGKLQFVDHFGFAFVFLGTGAMVSTIGLSCLIFGLGPRICCGSILIVMELNFHIIRLHIDKLFGYRCDADKRVLAPT